MKWWISLAGLTSGCGLLIYVATDSILPVGESSLIMDQAGVEFPVEVRFVGDSLRWDRTGEGAIRLYSGTALALRVTGLTMFMATLQLHSSGGYRLLLRTTPLAWRQQGKAPVELMVLPDRVILQAVGWQDTLEAPTSGSHRWHLIQWERGVEARLECLPPLWLPAEPVLTEWILLQPLPGSVVTVEGVTIREAVPFLQVGKEQEE